MKIFILLLLVFASTSKCLSQDTSNDVTHLTKLPPEGVLLDKDWKFIFGDNPAYANPAYDAGDWETINPTLDIYDLPQIPKSGIVWFRLRLLIDTSLDRQLALIIQQSGASEIYLDGQLIHRFGILSSNPSNVRAYDPLWKPVSFPIKKSTVQVLAVRFALQPNIRYTTIVETNNHALWIKIKDVESGVSFYEQQVSRFKWLHIFIIGVCFLFCLLHFAFYLFYPSQKANFYFAMFGLFYVTAIVLQHIFYLEAHEIKHKFFLANFSLACFMVGNMFLLTAIQYLLKQKKDLFYYSLIFYVIISFFLNAGLYRWGWLVGGILAQNLIQINILRISVLALRRKMRGALIIVAGAIPCFIFFLIFIAQGKIVNDDFFLTISPLSTVLFYISLLSIPLAASIYLGLDFAFVNDSLQQKLKEVNDLSAKNLAQEREKQQMLVSQNETLEQQVTERTSDLKKSLEDLKSTQAQLIQSEKMASLGELTAGIAHEIQNPLNFVNNFSDTNTELIEELKAELATGNKQEAILIADDIKANEQKINHHGKRADAIVKGMLQHSRISSGKKEPTDINALAEEYLRLSYHGLRAKDKDFTADFKTDFDESLSADKAGIGKIDIAPQDIGRVLFNLFNNAFYATNEKKKTANKSYKPLITVRTSMNTLELIPGFSGEGRGAVLISVHDNGPGIPQNIVCKIFQPFFTTKPTGQGTGLGLSLSYDIIKAHGGELKLETKEGEGAKFIIGLPV